MKTVGGVTQQDWGSSDSNYSLDEVKHDPHTGQFSGSGGGGADPNSPEQKAKAAEVTRQFAEKRAKERIKATRRNPYPGT